MRDKARKVTEDEAMRLVLAGCDLLHGADRTYVEFEWREDGAVSVRFVLYNGRNKQELICWDAERSEPYLVGVLGERWYHIPCVTTRGSQGMLAVAR